MRAERRDGQGAASSPVPGSLNKRLYPLAHVDVSGLVHWHTCMLKVFKELKIKLVAIKASKVLFTGARVLRFVREGEMHTSWPPDHGTRRPQTDALAHTGGTPPFPSTSQCAT